MTETNSTTPPAPDRRIRRRAIMRLLLFLVVLWFGWEFYYIVLGRNFHTLIEGRVYRSAQLSPAQYQELIDTYGIRTIINLRGCCLGHDWYEDECQVTHQHNLNHEDVTLSANRLPPPAELHRLVEVLDRTEYPILIHCRQGADRTGLVSAMIVLLYTDGDLNTARWYCSPRYGHIGLGTTHNIDRFFNLYESHLVARSWNHTPKRFREWVLHDYIPGPCSADLSLVREPEELSPAEPLTLTLRAENTSNETWHLKPGTGAGIRARYIVCDVTGQQVYLGHAGLFRREVPPGESIDLTLAVPPLKVPGNYVLLADLLDEEDCTFSQVGSEPLVRELTVR